MNHLTDHDIAKFWMGGLETEDEFNGNITHLHQCKVCRERAWHWLADMRGQTKKILEGLAEAMKGGLASSLASGFSSKGLKEIVASFKNSPAFIGVELSAEQAMGAAHGMTMAIKGALDRLIKEPDRQEWDADDLFDNDRFDDLDHLARCKQCRHIFDEMLHITEKVMLKSEKDPNGQKLNVAAMKLQKWFQIVRKKFREIMDLSGLTDEEDSAGGTSRVHFN